MQKQDELLDLKPNVKDQKQTLLGQNITQDQPVQLQHKPQDNKQKAEEIKRQEDQIIDPIEQILKKNNIMPLLAVIDQYDLSQKIQDKPLISIMATKFIPLEQILKNREITFPLDDDRRTPLHYAIEANDVKAAAWLIEKGNPNQQDNFGNTPMLEALRLGRRRCFLLCLKNKYYDERAPVFAAMYNRHWQLKVMYGMKIDIFAYRDEENKSSYERALQYCSFDCAQFMVKVKPSLNVQKSAFLTESKGLIRKLKKIKQELSATERFKQILQPLLILVVIFVGLSGDFFNSSDSNPYENTVPFYMVIMLLIFSLYGFMVFFGALCKGRVEYTQKNKLGEILQQPGYRTLPEICPVCLHFTEYQYIHCYTCGCCVQKFHFHSFVCINKSNEVFWILSEFVWLYLSGSLLHQFLATLASSQISILSVSTFQSIRLVASLENLLATRNFISICWLGFFVFLYLYQFFYCLSIVGMMCMRRKFEEVIRSEKFSHLYHVVKIEDNFMSKEKKIFQRGFLGGIMRCTRNFLLYFFIDE